MRQSTRNRDSILFAREDVRCAGTSADIGGATRRERTVDTLSTPETELNHGLSLRCKADTSALRGDQRLKVEEIQQWGFEQLPVQDRALHADQRFMREDDGSL